MLASRWRVGALANSSISWRNSSRARTTTTRKPAQSLIRSDMPGAARCAVSGPYPSVQLPFRHRSLELRDFGGLRRLAVEGQHVAFHRNHDAIAILDLAGEDHFRQRILQIALDHPLQRSRAIGGVPALGGQPVARRGIERERDLAVLQELLQPA